MEFNSKTLLSLSVLLAGTGASGLAAAAKTQLVSYTPQQVIGNDASTNASLARGGKVIVFESLASNLVPYSKATPNGDGNLALDIFMRSGNKKLSRISVNSLGQEAENSATTWYDPGYLANSSNASVSADGKLVVFESYADNLDLLTKDSNANGLEKDIFIRDIAKKKTYRLSGVMDAADGTVTPGLTDVFLQPLSKADAPWKITTEADGVSYNPVVVGTTKNGTVAFRSDASNLMSYLVPAFPVTGINNVYAMSLQTKKPELINAVHDPVTGVPTTNGDSTDISNNFGKPALSQDGRFVVFASDDHNLVNGITYPSGLDGNSNIFIYDRQLFQMYQLSGIATVAGSGFAITTEGNANSANPSITGGGKGKNYLIAFESRATDMDSLTTGPADAANTSDVFVVEFGPVNPKDKNSAYEIKASTATGQVIRRISAQVDISTGLATVPGSRLDGTATAQSTVPVIAGSSKAYTVAFRSTADNLIADANGQYWNTDTNNSNGSIANNTDIYVFTSKTKMFTRANVDSKGQQGTASASDPAIAPDGKGICFDTNDRFLVPASYVGSTALNGAPQLYLRK